MNKSKSNQILRVAGLLLVFALLGNGIPAGADEPSTEESMRPQGVDCEGFRFLKGIGPVCPGPTGLWEVFSPQGESLGYTHGGDPHPEGHEHDDGDQGQMQGPYSDAVIPPTCVSSTSDHYAVVIYAHAYDDEDRWSDLYWDISDLVVAMNTHLRVDAGQHDVKVDFKVRCNTSGLPHVYKATLPTPKDSASFSTIVNDLRNMGYDSYQRKYIVWYDDTSACACAGTGHIYNDDRRIVDNHNNGVTGSGMFGVTFGVMSMKVMMHENGHNMGAVQLSAPHSTGGPRHCTDGYDIMCYDDGGPNGDEYTTSVCRSGSLIQAHRVFYDCNNDDYFHPAAPSGSYLADHWNVGWSANRFLAFDTCGLAREGRITAPGAGLYVRDVSWYTEADIPSSCWGKPVRLEAVTGADFNLCFYQGTQRLGCLSGTGDEAGTIPSGTTDIRVYLYFGLDDRYLLYMP